MSGTDGAERVGEGAAPDNRALREAMAAMAALASEQTERAISALFAALAESFLLVPVTAAGEQGAELALVREADGRAALHAFTDEAALAAALPAQSPRVGVAAAKLAEVVLAIPEATLVLDPGSPSAGRLSRRDLELVRERLAPGPERSAALAAGALVPLAPAEPLPGALICALEEAALAASEVLALYAFDGVLGEGGRHPLVGARLDPWRPGGERRRALRELTEAARAHLPAEATLDLIALTPALLEPVARAGELLWERRASG